MAVLTCWPARDPYHERGQHPGHLRPHLPVRLQPHATAGGATFGIIAAISQWRQARFVFQRGCTAPPRTPTLAEVKDPTEQGVVQDRRVRGHHRRRHHDRPRGAVGALRGRRRAGHRRLRHHRRDHHQDQHRPAGLRAVSSARTWAPGSWPSAFVLRAFLHHPFVEPVREAERGMALRQERRHALLTIIALAFIFMGSLLSNDLVWSSPTCSNQLMVIPNAIAACTVRRGARHRQRQARQAR